MVCNRVLTHSPILAVQDPVISLKIENYMYFKFLKNSLVQANNYKEWSIKGINTHFTKEQNPDIFQPNSRLRNGKCKYDSDVTTIVHCDVIGSEK